MKYIYVRNGMYIKVGNWASNRMFHNRRFDSDRSIKSTVAQSSNQRLDKHRINDCTSVRLCNSRIDGYIDYLKKKKQLRFLDVASVPM